MVERTLKPRLSSQLPMWEFVTLIAFLNALVALSIDGILPALPALGRDLGVVEANDTQLVVSVFFLGLSLGQLLSGPLSDWKGRKPIVGLGILIFVGGSLLSMWATSLDLMLWGRFLQGAGLACPRTASMALVRDLFSGDSMAQVMSFIMAVFILVPLVAPAVGQAILLVADWRAIFGVFMIFSVVMGVWFLRRQPETLAVEHRMPLSGRRLLMACREVLFCRLSMGYVVMASLVSGAFIGYLSTAQQIFQELFDLGTLFPLAFAALAASIGVAAVVNGRLVQRFGMRSMVRWSLYAMTLLSTGYLLALWIGGASSLTSFMTYMALNLFMVGVLFGNLNSLAMEPLGHVAGLGAAVVGSATTFFSAGIGVMVGKLYDQTLVPLVASFALLGVLSIGTVVWTESGLSRRRSV